MTDAVDLQHEFDTIISTQVEPILQSAGFVWADGQYGRRHRPLYDAIEFQPNKWNDAAKRVGAFVNVGVGSIERALDKVPDLHVPVLPYIVSAWMEYLVDGLPDELVINLRMSPVRCAERFAKAVRRIVAAMDEFATTDDVVAFAAERRAVRPFRWAVL